MASLRFTQNIQRHVACPNLQVPGKTLQEALDAYFAIHPRARGYVLDDQGALRQHMAIFVDGEQLRDILHFSDALRENSVVDVVQALSGG
ncbi:MoaD/ThiS family protein [Bryobacter aggregatus]|uniref:MoaD/ThiS family protein n=1 Tax=Bryobacter aggregatus TaxID=360054 RepID=UPI0004E1CD80|nr:MoaD/ThiS family protein [Bryobacter aggregatus]